MEHADTPNSSKKGWKANERLYILWPYGSIFKQLRFVAYALKKWITY